MSFQGVHETSSSNTPSDSCPNENGDVTYLNIIRVSFAYYMLASCFMVVVLGIVLKKRGSWVAIVITSFNTLGYLLQCLTFSKFSD